MSKFASKSEKDFLMVSFLSTSMVLGNAWYVESGAYRHMTSAHELFSILTKQDLGFRVELGDDAKYLVGGVGTIPL